jgi:hypothetical protein
VDEESAMCLCSLLMKADSEETVITLLKETGYWDDPKAWRFYGDRETNFNTIGNQQSRTDSTALVVSSTVCLVLISSVVLGPFAPLSRNFTQLVDSA